MRFIVLGVIFLIVSESTRVFISINNKRSGD